MPAALLPPPSDRPIIAFFDVDNTLMRGTSIFHVGREAWSKKVIGWRDIAPFAWQQFRFISVGENDAHLHNARERALGLARGHTESEVLALAAGIWDHRIQRRLWPETVAIAQEHMAKGHEVWLISATPWEIGDLIARKLGLTGALGTQIEADRRRLHRQPRRARAARGAQGSRRPRARASRSAPISPTAGRTPTAATTSRCSSWSVTASW